MLEISNNVVFVSGAKNGAIYNFNNGHVYSLNSDACRILEKTARSTPNFSATDLDFLCLLENQGLINSSFYSKPFTVNTVPPVGLKLVWLEITQACNMKCIHCYEGQEHKCSKNVLCLDEWKTVINQISSVGVNRVVVIGGEPTMNNNVSSILEYLAKKNIPTTLFTNAYRIDERLKQIIVSKKIKVKVSIYGATAYAHDYITRTNGSFDMLINNIKFFLSNGVDVSAAITVMKENEEYLSDIKTLLSGLGIKSVKFDAIRKVYGGTQSEHIPCGVFYKENYYRSKPNFSTTKEKFIESMSSNTCWNRKIVITETGDVLPCVFARSEVMGNIRNESILGLMNSNQVKRCWGLSYSKIAECKECEFRFACPDCRPEAFAVCGNLYEKNPRCTYNPIEGTWQ